MTSLADRVIDTTRDYLAVGAVVGFEDPFFARLERDARDLGLAVERGERLLAVSGARPEAAVLTVHVDRHGLVATGGGELEYAAYVARALRYDERPAATRATLEKLCDRFAGERVRAYQPATGATLAEGAIEHVYLCPRRDNLVFRVPGLAELPLGTPVSYSPLCEVSQGAAGAITGQLDNAISAALVRELFADGFAGTALFAAEEEIGRSWQHLLAHLGTAGPPRRDLVVLDTSPFPPGEGPEEAMVVLRRRDANGAFDPWLVARLEALCDERGIRCLLKDEWLAARAPAGEARLGSTELGRLATGSDGAWNGATVQIPTAGYHSNRETAGRPAIAAVATLLAAHLGLDGG